MSQRQCECGNVLPPLDLNDISYLLFINDVAKCIFCGTKDPNDSPDNRMIVIIEELIRLREIINTMKKLGSNPTYGEFKLMGV